MADDIRQWLEALGLDKYTDVFVENGIDLDIVGELNDDDLKSIGANLGDRKRLLRAIANQAVPSSATLADAMDFSRDVVIPDHIAERVATEADDRLAERKFITVLFADVYQSTALTEGLDPEDARQLLDSAIDHMAAAVHRYNGIVNKTLGDGIMALFGAPLALEDHAPRACYAALSMQRALAAAASEARRDFGTAIQARVGLHSGEVLVRAIKNDFSFDYDATGPAVNIAARMEQTALPGTIRLSHDTKRLIGDAIDAPSLGPLSIKGLSAPLEVHELRDMGAAPTQHTIRSGGQAPFVGRRQEVSFLQQAWHSAIRGRGQAIVYNGEAGVGKSRLYQKFLDMPQDGQRHILRGELPIHGKASPFRALITLLSEYFGIKVDDDHKQLRERMRQGLSQFRNTGAELQVPLLALFQVPNDDEAWRLADPMQRRRRTLNSLIEFFSQLAARSPLVLVFEDVQRADSDSLAFFEELIEALLNQPILLLLNHRREFVLTWPSQDHFHSRELSPLESGPAGDFLDKLLGGDEELKDLKCMLIARSGGNPMFLEEALGELVENGALMSGPPRMSFMNRPSFSARASNFAPREKEPI